MDEGTAESELFFLSDGSIEVRKKNEVITRIRKANPDVMFYVSRVLARRLESLNKYLVDVKHQLREQEGHVGMIDSVLDALMVRHPRQVKTHQPAGE